MSTKLVTAYRYDKDGYYMGTDQVMNNLVPSDDTLIAPENKDGYWPRFVNGAWTYEKMPASAEDFLDSDIVVEHKSHTPHTEALRSLIRAVAPATETPGALALKQDKETNNLSVVKVPELTEAEITLKEDEAADNSLTQQINDLKDQMTSAMLMGDEEWIAELQAEYKALMGV